MFDDEGVDVFLRDAMQTSPVPALSSSFDRDLDRHLRPARISPGARLALLLYVVLASIGSIWALSAATLGTVAIVGAILTPIVVSAVVLRRHVRAALRARQA